VFTLGQIGTSELQAVLFYFFAALACVSALGVVFSKQIVRMALWLLGTLVSVAALYFLIHAELIAAIQLIVYAGGTLILIVFGIMLTTSNPLARLQIRPGEMAIGLAAGLVALILMGYVALRWSGPVTDSKDLAQVTEYPVVVIGRVLLSRYMIPFEVAGVLLLVVMIAAAYLAKGRRVSGEGQAK